MILNQFHIKAAATTTATEFNTPKIIDLFECHRRAPLVAGAIPTLLSLFRRKGHQREIVEGLPADLPSPRYLCKKDV